MRRTILLILMLTFAWTGEAVASGTDVLRDCTDDGRLQKTYTQQELRQALADIPSDVDEYTDCRDVIKAAQLSGAGNDGGGDTGSGDASTGGTGSTGSPTTGAGGDAGATGDDAGSTGSATSGSGGDAEDDNPPTGSTAGSFGGFTGFEEDPMKAASDEEQQAIADALASRPAAATSGSGPFADADLPTALWIVLGLGAAGLIALAASDLRRRVVARRSG